MASEDDISKLTGDMYRQWEKAMGTWWDQTLESPAFLNGVNENLKAQATARKGYTEQVDKAMTDMHLPSRQDVVRIAKIASLLEDKVLAVEDRLLAIGDTLARIEKDTLRARVDAAKALVTVQERLISIEERLDRIATALDLREKPAPSRARAGKA